MNIYDNERTAIFIDGSNLYSAARAVDIEIDYRRLLKVFGEKGDLLRAYYYITLYETEDYSPIRPLVDWLQYNGFSVVTKPGREFIDSNGVKRTKGDMSVDMAVDMLRIARRVDHIIMFSGDGDLTRCIAELQSMGVRITIVSTTRSSPPIVSDDLRRTTDHFIDLVDIEESIRRQRPGSSASGSYDLHNLPQM